VPYTNSAAVDMSASTTAPVVVIGNDPTATQGFDLFVSPDSTSWTFIQSFWPSTMDGRGVALMDRQGCVVLDVAGINWVRLQAHAAETVTASCYSA